MSETSSMLLIGVGGSGSAIARGVSRAFGEGLRFAMIDTDASTGELGGNFLLIGGDRLSGRGTGGNIVTAKTAFDDSRDAIDKFLEGVRTAVVVTSLGGGTGGGATCQLARLLAGRGIRSIVFATTPFQFEGENRQRSARSVMSLIAADADASFFLPLDRLADGADRMDDAMRRAVDTVASGITLFWRLVEKPGYIKLDPERVRDLIGGAGRGRFATFGAQGPNRAAEIVEAAAKSEMLAGDTPAKSILCGILAGEDLRLSEISRIADGIREAFGRNASFELSTVNDEETFTGRISAVVMLFEGNGRGTDSENTGGRRAGRRVRNILSVGPQGRGRFSNSEPTLRGDEDLDIPTYVRKDIDLDY
ncbi:MAG: hypothetical protein ILO34_04405 [Kiritimatiellae bacterium]|nr:hypothetical protein [Kiritimatiellia bacterium]